MVLRNLPTTVLMSVDDLINLGLLPPVWPNHGKGWSAGAGEPHKMDFPAGRNMTQKEVYKNTLLTISLGDELQETYGEIPLE